MRIHSELKVSPVFCPVPSSASESQGLGALPPSLQVSPNAYLTCLLLFPIQVARWEQKTRKLSQAMGSPYLACYVLGGVILLLNVLRSHW